MFTMHFDVEFSPVSMTSRPLTIGKVAMFWPSCRDHGVTMQVHEISQPITRCQARQPHAGDAVDKLTASCHVDTMAAVSWIYVGKNVKITSEWWPSVHNHINNLSKKLYKYFVGKILLELLHHLFKKSSSPLNCTFTLYKLHVILQLYLYFACSSTYCWNIAIYVHANFSYG